jgi:hypothetical protein
VERPRPTEYHRPRVIQPRLDDVVQVCAEQIARPHSKNKERTDRADLFIFLLLMGISLKLTRANEVWNLVLKMVLPKDLGFRAVEIVT